MKKSRLLPLILAILLLGCEFSVYSQFKKRAKKDPKAILEAINITFSSKPFSEGQEATTNETVFDASANIYGQLNLGIIFSELVYPSKPKNVNTNFSVWAQLVDGGKKFHMENVDVKNDNNFDKYYLNINPSPDKAKYGKLFSALKEGENKVKFWVIIEGGTNAGETEIILKKQGGTGYSIGKSFDDYKAEMKNEKFEQGIKSAAQKLYDDAGSKVKVLGVKIANSSWFIEKHKVTGHILNRQLGAFVYAKWPNGECTVQKFTFSQNYAGGKYSDVFKRYSSKEKELVDCK